MKLNLSQYFPVTQDLTPINSFQCDSRKVKPGALFFALPGENVHGVNFLQEAASRGAAAAIIPSDYSGELPHIPVIPVGSPRETLQSLARQALRDSSNAQIIAITGSEGKTTTKDFIATLLSEEFRTLKTEGSQNSQIGLPLFLLNNVMGDEEKIVLEMGMSEKGNIANLISIAPPDIAVITTIGHSHIGFFPTPRDLALEKGQILTHPKTSLALISNEIPFKDEVMGLGTCKKKTFSTISQADYTLKDISYLDTFTIPGIHNRHNLLAAVAVARECGVSSEAIKRGIPKLQLPEYRYQLFDRNGIHFINDSYNASPAAMKAALLSMQDAPFTGKRIGVIGQMAELGKMSEQIHREIAEYALDKLDVALCLGKDCKHFTEVWKEKGKNALLYTSREELTTALKQLMQKGDVVLLKGANSNQLWRVLEGLE